MTKRKDQEPAEDLDEGTTAPAQEDDAGGGQPPRGAEPMGAEPAPTEPPPEGGLTKPKRPRRSRAKHPAPLPAEEPAEDLGPQEPSAEDLAAENATVRARLAALEAGSALASPTGPPARWRVSLAGLKVRVVDDRGRVATQDHLELTAASKADAEEAFRVYNGIISTSAAFTTERLDS